MVQNTMFPMIRQGNSTYNCRIPQVFSPFKSSSHIFLPRQKPATDNQLSDNQLPDNQLPDNQLPENQLPDNQLPDNQLPENQLPDNQLPDTYL
ncbi:hypothetical protein QBC33DRAFT_180111 [Phialemonium atrogriseum]|uniref:Uncharacterized protein n=1 Tax=Phialemonium atrogriseum TaxID=1093897 RepID=A0AAJ0BVI3_9PEZI|nr:uncharacterized protein QBC33DRAFT_180111 [Phialemonium atrogriseum]KAK1765031.1 hypothetical protein QBC33DRAFT_180111 [Phialemonium atrogriseum]